MDILTTATPARSQQILNTRTLDQIITDLEELGNREYSQTIAAVTHFYITNIEARFPELAAKAWENIDAAIVGIRFVDALKAARN